jgi:nucleoside-diphosphate-sugar epimerase
MIPKTTKERQDFFDVNVKGSENLLRGLERAAALPKAFIFVSSVAVYGLDEGVNIDENHPLLALDPYGYSKIQAESLIQDWCKANAVVCTILRLPLLAGPNPPGNLNSMIKAIQSGYYLNINGGNSKKSIVLAEDVAKAIRDVSNIGGIYNLTDRYHPDFLELSSLIAQQLGKSLPKNIPLFIAKLLASGGDFVGDMSPINSMKLKKITADLTFNDDKAVSTFGWNPTPILNGFKIR